MPPLAPDPSRFSLVLTLFICYAASLAQADTPYGSICARNAFGLKPRPAVSTTSPHPPFPKIRLTGITTILKGKRALFKVEFPGKPPDKAESYILKEGQRAGELEVLQINEKNAVVEVEYSGTVTNLTFEKPSPLRPATPKPRAVGWRGMAVRAGYR